MEDNNFITLNPELSDEELAKFKSNYDSLVIGKSDFVTFGVTPFKGVTESIMENERLNKEVRRLQIHCVEETRIIALLVKKLGGNVKIPMLELLELDTKGTLMTHTELSNGDFVITFKE